MKKLIVPILALSLVACGESGSAGSGSDSTAASSEPISLTRETVKKEAVATYEVPAPDALNKDWKFAVNLYETPDRFKFLVKMDYQAMSESDTINIPNFNTEPRPQIKQGDTKMDCIIGFLDKQGTFKEYILVAVKDDQLTMKTIKHYQVTTQ